MLFTESARHAYRNISSGKWDTGYHSRRPRQIEAVLVFTEPAWTVHGGYPRFLGPPRPHLRGDLNLGRLLGRLTYVFSPNRFIARVQKYPPVTYYAWLLAGPQSVLTHRHTAPRTLFIDFSMASTAHSLTGDHLRNPRHLAAARIGSEGLPLKAQSGRRIIRNVLRVDRYRCRYVS
jgi:hypothetical protein